MLKSDLLEICRQKGYVRYSKLKKEDLRTFIIQQNTSKARLTWAVSTISAFYKNRKRIFLNEFDPITLEPIDPTERFLIKHYVNAKRTAFYQFETMGLMKYFLTSGKFDNPFCNLPISDTDLIRLHEAVTLKTQFLYYCINNTHRFLGPDTDILALKEEIISICKIMRQQNETYELLMHESDDILTNVIGSINAVDANVDTSIIVHVISFYMIQFFSNVTHMSAIDPSRATRFLDDCKAMVTFNLRSNRTVDRRTFFENILVMFEPTHNF